MDKLEKIFEIQSQLQKMHGHNFETMTVEEKEAFTKDTVLYILEETHELLREINFKTYKKARKPVVIEKIQGEIVDILHFVINTCLVWGVSADQIFEGYKEKNATNIQRLQNPKY
jgi:dimeric dUTPase (all-alpha-NTP-PPase superfamily)